MTEFIDCCYLSKKLNKNVNNIFRIVLYINKYTYINQLAVRKHTYASSCPTAAQCIQIIPPNIKTVMQITVAGVSTAAPGYPT